MGPSVKFVLPIIDAFPDQKSGGNFLCGKKGQTGGGGPGGGLSGGGTFSRHSFLNVSLFQFTLTISDHNYFWCIDSLLESVLILSYQFNG